MKLNKKTAILTLTAVVAVIICILLGWGNKAITVTEFKVTDENIPSAFSGFRIAQVSDLHNAEFGKGNSKLIAMLKETEPDIIVITGDMIDSRRTNIDISLDFAEKAVEIAPTYYINGNHEQRISQYEQFRDSLSELGVTVLEDEKVKIQKGEDSISLIGLIDPAFKVDWVTDDQTIIVKDALDSLTDDEEYQILLSHKPRFLSVYAESGVNLVLSGHVHGGQFRLPFIGGLFSPDEGLFPKYDGGLYTEGDTNMIVSRGLGNSIIPLRINNRPEIVVAEISAV